MLYDLVALQALYGPNMSTRTGDTLYDFEGYFESLPSIQRTIWDAGGNDTLSAAGMDRGAVLDIREGAFSSMGTVTNNIAIAFNVSIENAAGAGFDDTITGNHLDNVLTGEAGNDTIWSNSGDDLMKGGTGNDTYRYQIGDENDTINEEKLGGRDTLRLDTFAGLDTFSNDIAFRRAGTDLIIDLTSVYAQTTTVNKYFSLTGTSSSFGFLVAPAV
jgi:Ca2+-binding RTX toxin-like protein